MLSPPPNTFDDMAFSFFDLMRAKTGLSVCKFDSSYYIFAFTPCILCCFPYERVEQKTVLFAYLL